MDEYMAKAGEKEAQEKNLVKMLQNEISHLERQVAYYKKSEFNTVITPYSFDVF